MEADPRNETPTEIAPPGADPLTSTLRLLAGGLLVVVLAAVLSFTLYLQGLDAPRTAAERNLATWRTAVEEQPEVLENHVKLAYAYALAGRYDEALSTIDAASSMTDSPELAVVIAHADILRASGALEEAIAEYDDAAAEARSVYDRQVDEAKEKGVLFSPPNTTLARVLRGRAVAHKETGDVAAAVADLRAALDIERTDASAWVLLGEYLAEDGDDEGAALAFAEALRYVPDMPEALVGLRELEGR